MERKVIVCKCQCQQMCIQTELTKTPHTSYLQDLVNEKVGNKQKEQESIIGITANILFIAFVRLVEDTSKGNGPGNAPDATSGGQEIGKKGDTQIGFNSCTSCDQIGRGKRNTAPNNFGVAKCLNTKKKLGKQGMSSKNESVEAHALS